MMNVGILSKHTNIVDLKISFGLNSYVNFSTAFFRKKISFCVPSVSYSQLLFGHAVYSRKLLE